MKTSGPAMTITLLLCAMIALAATTNVVRSAEAVDTDFLLGMVVKGTKRALVGGDSECLDGKAFNKFAEEIVRTFIFKQTDTNQKLLYAVYKNGHTKLTKKWLPLVNPSSVPYANMLSKMLPAALNLCEKQKKEASMVFKICSTWLEHSGYLTEFLQEKLTSKDFRAPKKSQKKALQVERKALRNYIQAKAAYQCKIKELLEEIAPDFFALDMVKKKYKEASDEAIALASMFPPKQRRKLLGCLAY